MSRDHRPFYRGGPFTSLEALAAISGSPVEEICLVAAAISDQYRLVKILKPDGTYRDCWDPSVRLRRIQRALVVNVLRKVLYPDYLHGSLQQRDYITNAAVHRGARWGVCMDIKNFFGSISSSHVRDELWRRFFGCSVEVADLLTKITTLNGYLPQGSLTASYLANLALWKFEPHLVERLEEVDLRYTRYVDDITISSASQSSRTLMARVIGETNRMLRLNGLVQKRSKFELATRARGMTIGGLHVGSERVGRSKRQRQAIASAVLDYAGIAASLSLEQARRLAKSLFGRVAELERHHPREAQHLHALLWREVQEVEGANQSMPEGASAGRITT